MKQRFHVVNDAVKQNAINFIRELPVDQKRPLVLDIKEMTRTLQQNAKLWPLLKDLSEQVVWFGNKYDSDDWKDLITAMVAKAKKQEQRMAPGLDGGIVMFGQRTSKMTVRQMVEVMEANAYMTSLNLQGLDLSAIPEDVITAGAYLAKSAAEGTLYKQQTESGSLTSKTVDADSVKVSKTYASGQATSTSLLPADVQLALSLLGQWRPNPLAFRVYR